MIKWDAVTEPDQDTIHKIATRAVVMAAEVNPSAGYKLMDAVMDLTACHTCGNPLRLDKLLAADNQDFAHDVFGIRRHLNHETGTLMDCFCPRYSEVFAVLS